MYNEIIDLEELADRTHEKIVKVYITDLLKNYNKTKWEDLTICDRQKLVDWAYSFYFKSISMELDLSLDHICGNTFDHRKEILADKYDMWQFIDILAKH